MSNAFKSGSIRKRDDAISGKRKCIDVNFSQIDDVKMKRGPTTHEKRLTGIKSTSSTGQTRLPSNKPNASKGTKTKIVETTSLTADRKNVLSSKPANQNSFTLTASVTVSAKTHTKIVSPTCLPSNVPVCNIVNDNSVNNNKLTSNDGSIGRDGIIICTESTTDTICELVNEQSKIDSIDFVDQDGCESDICSTNQTREKVQNHSNSQSDNRDNQANLNSHNEMVGQLSQDQDTENTTTHCNLFEQNQIQCTTSKTAEINDKCEWSKGVRSRQVGSKMPFGEKRAIVKRQGQCGLTTVKETTVLKSDRNLLIRKSNVSVESKAVRAKVRNPASNHLQTTSKFAASKLSKNITNVSDTNSGKSQTIKKRVVHNDNKISTTAVADPGIVNKDQNLSLLTKERLDIATAGKISTNAISIKTDRKGTESNKSNKTVRPNSYGPSFVNKECVDDYNMKICSKTLSPKPTYSPISTGKDACSSSRSSTPSSGSGSSTGGYISKPKTSTLKKKTPTREHKQPAERVTDQKHETVVSTSIKVSEQSLPNRLLNSQTKNSMRKDLKKPCIEKSSRTNTKTTQEPSRNSSSLPRDTTATNTRPDIKQSSFSLTISKNERHKPDAHPVSGRANSGNKSKFAKMTAAAKVFIPKKNGPLRTHKLQKLGDNLSHSSTVTDADSKTMSNKFQQSNEVDVLDNISVNASVKVRASSAKEKIALPCRYRSQCADANFTDSNTISDANHVHATSSSQAKPDSYIFPTKSCLTDLRKVSDKTLSVAANNYGTHLGRELQTASDDNVTISHTCCESVDNLHEITRNVDLLRQCGDGEKKHVCKSINDRHVVIFAPDYCTGFRDSSSHSDQSFPSIDLALKVTNDCLSTSAETAHLLGMSIECNMENSSRNEHVPDDVDSVVSSNGLEDHVLSTCHCALPQSYYCDDDTCFVLDDKCYTKKYGSGVESEIFGEIFANRLIESEICGEDEHIGVKSEISGNMCESGITESKICRDVKDNCITESELIRDVQDTCKTVSEMCGDPKDTGINQCKICSDIKCTCKTASEIFREVQNTCLNESKIFCDAKDTFIIASEICRDAPDTCLTESEMCSDSKYTCLSEPEIFSSADDTCIFESKICSEVQGTRSCESEIRDAKCKTCDVGMTPCVSVSDQSIDWQRELSDSQVRVCYLNNEDGPLKHNGKESEHPSSQQFPAEERNVYENDVAVYDVDKSVYVAKGRQDSRQVIQLATSVCQYKEISALEFEVDAGEHMPQPTGNETCDARQKTCSSESIHLISVKEMASHLKAADMKSEQISLQRRQECDETGAGILKAETKRQGDSFQVPPVDIPPEISLCGTMTSVADKHQGFVDSCCLIDTNFAGQSTDMCSSSMTCKEYVRDKKHLEHLRDKNSFSGSEKTTDFSPDLTSEVVLESDVQNEREIQRMKCLFCRQSAELSETKCVNEHIVLNKNCIEYCSDTERTTLKLESDIGDNSTSVTSTSVSALTSGIKVISADSHDEDGRTIACIAKNGTSGEQDVKTNVDHCQVDDVTETLTSFDTVTSTSIYNSGNTRSSSIKQTSCTDITIQEENKRLCSIAEDVTGALCNDKVYGTRQCYVTVTTDASSDSVCNQNSYGTLRENVVAEIEEPFCLHLDNDVITDCRKIENDGSKDKSDVTVDVETCYHSEQKNSLTSIQSTTGNTHFLTCHADSTLDYTSCNDVQRPTCHQPDISDYIANNLAGFSNKENDSNFTPSDRLFQEENNKEGNNIRNKCGTCLKSVNDSLCQQPEKYISADLQESFIPVNYVEQIITSEEQSFPEIDECKYCMYQDHHRHFINNKFNRGSTCFQEASTASGMLYNDARLSLDGGCKSNCIETDPNKYAGLPQRNYPPCQLNRCKTDGEFLLNCFVNDFTEKIQFCKGILLTCCKINCSKELCLLSVDKNQTNDNRNLVSCLLNTESQNNQIREGNRNKEINISDSANLEYSCIRSSIECKQDDLFQSKTSEIVAESSADKCETSDNHSLFKEHVILECDNAIKFTACAHCGMALTDTSFFSNFKTDILPSSTDRCKAHTLSAINVAENSADFTRNKFCTCNQRREGYENLIRKNIRTGMSFHEEGINEESSALDYWSDKRDLSEKSRDLNNEMAESEFAWECTWYSDEHMSDKKSFQNYNLKYYRDAQPDKMSGLSPVKITTQKCIANQVFPEEIKESRDSIAGFESRRTQKISGDEEYNCIVRSESGASLNERRIDCNLSTLEASRDRDSRNEINLNQPEQSLQSTREHGKFDVSDSKISAECKIECHELGLNHTNFSLGFNECEILQPPCEKTFASAKTECPCLSTYGAGLNHLEFSNQASGGLANDNPVSTLGARCHISKIVNNASDVSSNHLQSNRSLVLKDVKLSDIDVADLNLVCGFKGHVLENSAEICAELNQNKYSNNIISSSEHVEGSVNNETTNDLDLIDETSRTDVNETDTTSSNQRLSLTSSGSCVSDSSERFVDAPEEPLDLIIESHSTHDVIDNVTLPEQGNLSQHTVQSDLLSGIGERKQENSSDESDVILCDTSLTPSSTFGHELLKLEAGECLYKFSNKSSSVDSFHDAVEHLDDDFLTSFNTSTSIREDTDDTSSLTSSKSTTSLDNYSEWDDFDDDLEDILKYDETMANERTDERDDSKIALNQASAGNSSVYFRRNILKDNAYLKTVASANGDVRYAPTSRNILRSNDAQKDSVSKVIGNIISKNNYDRQVQENGCSGTERKNDAGCGFKQQNDVNFTHTDASKMRDVISETSKGQLNKNNDNASASSESGKDVSTKVSCVNKNDVNINVASKIETALVKRNERRRRKRIERQINGMTSGVTCSTHVESSESGVHIFREEKNQACIITHNESIHGSSVQNSSNIETVCQNTDKPQSGWKTEPVCETKSAPVSEKLNITDSDSASLKHNASSLKKLNDPEYQNAENKCAATKNTAEVACLEIDLQINNSIKSESDDYPMEEKLVCKNCENKTSNMETGFKTSISDKVQNFKENELDDIEFIDADCTDAIEDSNRPVNDINIMQKGQNPDHVMTSESDGLVTHCVIHDDVTVAKEETPSPNVTYTLTYEDDDRAEAFVYEVVREEKSKANNECNHSESCHDTVSDTSHQSAEASRHHSDTIPTRNDDVIKSNDGVIKSSDEIINSHLGHNMSSEHTTMYRDCATGFINEKATESVICNGELKSESVAIVSDESNNVKEAEISEESNISVKHALELERQKMKTVKESSNMKSTFTNKRSGRRNTAENKFETNNDGREENGAIESKDVAKKPFTAIRKSKSFRFERNIEPENVAAEKTKDNESPQLPKKVSDICLNFMTKARSAATRTRTQTASESPAPNRKLMKWVVDNGKWMRIPISADDDESEAMVNSKPEDHDENDSQRHVMERKTVIKSSNNDICIRLTKSENIEQNKNIVLEDVIVTINNTIEIETESSYNCVNGVNTDATKAFTIVEDQSLKTHDSQANQNIPVAILVLNTTVDRLVKASDDENALSPNKTDAKEIIQNDIQTLHITEQRLHEKKTNVTSNDEITEDKIEEHSESKPLKALVFNSETDLKKPTLKQRLFRNDQSNFADVIISEEGLNDGFRKSSRLLDQKVEQIGETVINENIENDVKIIGTALDEAKCGTEKHQIRQELLFGILDSFNRRKPRKMYRSPVRIPAQNDFASQMKLPEAIQGTSNSRRTEPSNNITQVHMGGNDASSIPKLKAVKIDEEIFESETPNPCDVEGMVLSSGLESIRRNSFRHETIHNSLDSIDRGKVMTLHMRKSKTFAGLCAEDRDDDNNHRYKGMRETESTSRSSAVNASQNDDVSDVPLRVKSPEQIARQQQRHKLLSEIAEVEESREGVTATFESKREHHHKQQQQQPRKQPQRPRSSKDQQRGQTPLPRGNKHRSLSLPTGTLAFGNTRIVYKDGHFTFETMATNDLDFHNEQTGFQGSADNVSMPETSPEEYSREAIQSFRSSPREATKMHNKPSLRRQIGKAALANGESQEDVFYADGDDHIQNKCLSEEFSLSNLAPCLDDYMNESYLSNYSENNLTVSDRLSLDSDDKFESQVKKLSSSSLPEGVKDEEVKRVMQRAKRTSSFRQAQEVGSLRLSGIMEDAIHNSSRSSVVAIDDSGTNSGNNSPSVQNQSSTFIKKMMAKRKSANENLSLTTANKPSESAKDFFSKKVNFKGFFKKNKSDSSVSASPLKIDHPTSPPIAVFHQDDIESVATPPSSPYANREFRRRHTSADIYPSKPHSDSGEVDSNCPTPTQERCNFRQSVSNPTTPIHELNSNALKCVYARTKQVGTVTPRDDDQMSVSSACSISSSIQSPPPLEQPSKPKTPKPATITASPRRNPSSSSSLSRLGSQSSIKARNNSLNSLDCDINIDDARCECDLPPRSATLGRRRRNSDLTLTSTDSSSMCQYCTWMANSESVGFSYRSLGRPRKRSVSKDKMSERSPVARKDSYDRLGIIMQTDVTSSNSNDSGIQRDVSADSSNESLKAVHEGHIRIQRDQSTSPHPDRSKSEVGVRWADVEISDTVAADMTETSVVLRHHEGFSRPRPVSCVIEGSSCLFERLRTFGSEINLQPYGSLRNLYEMRRRDIDRQKNRRMSTPHPIKSRLQRSPQKLQKQPALVRSSSMPECLDKLHKRRKMHHLLDFHMDNLSKHNDNDSLSGDSDLSFDQTSLQGKSLSVRSSTSQLTGLDEYEDALTYAEALWDHITMDQEELVFRAQDLIEVVDMADRDWWYGVIEDREGWFPAAFVRIRVNQIQMEDDIDTSFAAPLLASPKLRRISIMNKDQARTNVVNEIINAEREYVKHLKDVVEGYIQHAKKRTEMFPEARIQLIFGNIETIYKFALKFVGQLETCIDVCPHLSEIGQCFLDNERGFEIYSDYCNNHPSACEELKELCRDSKYKHFFEACRLLQELVEIPLEGFLLTPVQKICKYPLQLAELLKYTPPEHPDFGRVQAALSAMRKIARLINERKRKMESIEKIAAWQHSVVDWEGGDLLERSSELIFSGELTKVNSAGWAQERAFFLFDHQIIYCKKDLLKRHVFIYKGRIDLDHCDVIDLEDGKDHQYNTAVKNAWKFHETRKDKWYLVCAKNAATKQRWLKAIQDQRQRVIEDQENDFCVPDHWKQTVLNKVRSHSNLKDKHSSRRPLHGQLSLHKDFKDSGYSSLPRQRISSSDSKGDKKGFWSKLGGGKKTKR